MSHRDLLENPVNGGMAGNDFFSSNGLSRSAPDSHKSIILTDLGFGDGGKGSDTLYLSWAEGAHTVMRWGGWQAFHHGKRSDGVEHICRQFGSGTLVGSQTYLSRNMIIEPFAILNEGRVLIEKGITDAFDRMTIDENALVVTPFHIAANRLRELARGQNRNGSVGLGVGETVVDSEEYPDIAIRAKDFGMPWLHEKLAMIRHIKEKTFEWAIGMNIGLPKSSQKELTKILDETLIEDAVSEYNYLARTVRIASGSYTEEILERPGTIVWEPSQGVLLDRWHGFHPHTTKTRPCPDAAQEILTEHGYTGEVKRYGLMRAYMTRHGAGPFVTESQLFSKLLPDPNNPENDWQEKLRVGYLDTVALRYAVNVCGGSGAFDGLIVNCLDQLSRLPNWQICDQYEYVGEEDQGMLEKFFQMDGNRVADIKVRHNTRDKAQLDYQWRLGKILRDCRPVLTQLKKGDIDGYLQFIQDRLGIPIRIVSFGPTEIDKRRI